MNYHVSQQLAVGFPEQREPAKAPAESVHLAVDYAVLTCLTEGSVDVQDPAPPPTVMALRPVCHTNHSATHVHPAGW